MNYSPLIYAFEQSQIAITGEGTLDGQSSAPAAIYVLISSSLTAAPTS